MKIIRADVWEVRIALEEPYAIAYSSVEDAVNVFLRLETSTGVVGYGCANPDEHVTGETPLSVRTSLHEACQGILHGADPLRLNWILAELEAHLPTQPSARAAIDMAFCDLVAKLADLPLWKFLGGFRDRIKTDITIGLLPIAATVVRAQCWLQQGFSALKLKGGLDVEDDIRRVWAVRESVGPRVELRFDANQGYTAEQAIHFAGEIRGAELAFLEQPTPRDEPHLLGQVQRAVEIPVMADESVLNSQDALLLARQEAVQMLNIKLMKTGGVLEAQRVAAIAQAFGMKVMVGCMDESALGISAGLHFACSCPTVTLADLDGHLGMLNDPAHAGFVLESGELIPSNEPGLGMRIEEPR